MSMVCGRQPDGSALPVFATLLPRTPAPVDPLIDGIPAIGGRWQYSLPCPGAGPLIAQLVAFELEQFSPDAFAICDIACPDHIARSVRKRQAEYVFGRLAARLALRQQSLIPVDSSLQIASGHSREPVWPATAVGSISHTAHLAAAAVAARGRWRGVGIDLEHVIDAGAHEALLTTVVNRAELSLLQSICASTGHPLDVLLTIAFSAKEAFFKASFAAVGRYFDFSSAQVVAVNLGDGWVRLCVHEHLCAELPSGKLCDVGVGLVDGQTVMTYRLW
ncbi:4'-phosphopantetheinyl transferase [Xanthomonas axonopodis pv. poinsettiicola]|uniref:4'-phosphopantetheinyl transferase family protein n=1 Tax=Xanthomonas TaxID=338 RepID=UPI001E3F024E|nr:4'-phosphopantetheinyl transferase superfamily protein [Xanthomonas codiaei]MCC8538930.1 4'-phosphopantetheinyl transferase superfamily protein [Xanthomonas codiaei]